MAQFGIDRVGVIDASDQRLQNWLAELSPRQELVMRMALSDRAINLGPGWEPRIDVLEKQLRINTEAKIAKPMREVHEADKAINRWVGKAIDEVQRDARYAACWRDTTSRSLLLN